MMITNIVSFRRISMRILELSEEAINGLSDNTLYFLYKKCRV